MELSVRPFQKQDLELIVDYFLNGDYNFLVGMGVLPEKLPKKADWIALLEKELETSNRKRAFYYLIWEVDGIASGHSNINKIKYGESATMHLHLWHQGKRKKGMGTEFVKMSLPFYFDNFDLQVLYCEPFSQNPPPNKTLARVGFEFEGAYTPPPGWINYEIELNRWSYKREMYKVRSKKY